MTDTNMDLERLVNGAVDDVRYTPPAPLGSGSQISATAMAELGAALAAAGMERSTIASLFHHVQAITVKNFAEAAPKVVEGVTRVHQARLNRVMQEIQQLTGIEVPNQAPGLMSRMAGVTGPTTTYVNKEAVLRLISMAMERQFQG